MNWTEAVAIKARCEPSLLQRPGILGVGVGPLSDGTFVLNIYLREPTIRRELPDSLEGLPVRVVISGPMTLYSRGL